MTAHKALRLLIMSAGIGVGNPAAAQDFSLNYERLSSLEAPLATEVGDVTFVLTGLLDAPFVLDLDKGDDRNADFIGNFQISALAQLPNRWRVGLSYFGQYATDEPPGAKPGEKYEDNAALSIGGVWGTVMGGNVSGIVREQTRRLRGAGNASLAFDDVLGGLGDLGGGYVGRFGPWVISATVDEDANFDVGAMYQRPFGTRDYRLTARYTEGVYTSVAGRRFDTRAVSGVGEFIYGSTAYDAGVGYERFSSRGLDTDRWYVSSGVRTKTGVLSLSLEGHYDRTEGEDEISAALGLQYDLARGLSANLGLNYTEARLNLNGGRFVDTKDTEVVISLRYSF